MNSLKGSFCHARTLASNITGERCRRWSASLSEVLSQVASESRSRKELVEQVKALGLLISSPGWDPNSRTGTGPGAAIPQLTPKHVIELLKALRRDPVWALRVYIWASRQSGYEHTDLTCTFIVDLWADTPPLKSFLDVLQNPSQPSSPDDYLLLIQGYGWAGMPDLAMTTLGRMITADITPDVSHFNSLLYILVECNRLKNIRELFKLMNESGVAPNNFTFALRIRGYCVAGQFDEAHKAFRQMLKAGFPPDIKTFGHLVDAMCKANKPYLIYVLPCDMDDNRFSPTDAIYYEMLEGLCRSQCVKYAEKLVKHIRRRNVEPDAKVCNILTKGFCHERKLHCALAQVNDMLKRGFLPDPDVFDLILIMLLKEGRIGNICRLMDKLMSKDFCPNVSAYGLLVYGLCKCEEVVKAFEAWSILVQYSLPDVKTYSVLIQGLCRSGMLVEAKEVFTTSIDRGFRGDDTAHDELLYRLKQAGRVNDAKECEVILATRRKVWDDTIDIFEDLSPMSSDSEFAPQSSTSEDTDSSSASSEEDTYDSD
ncbi:hypothetical protein L7F22_055960 [Adiantum nelumboides]|nr:hypothetical protein [Adiantum nelumboides]